jgi:putative ABC transport system permease protein
VYGLDMLVGVLVPVAAAAHPVAKGSAVSVKAALSDFGVGQAGFGASRLDLALAGVGGLTRPVLLALRNATRRRARFWMTLATLAAAGLFFIVALNARRSMIGTLDRLFAVNAYDLTVGLTGMHDARALARAARGTVGVRQVEAWITSEGALPDPKAAAADAPHEGLHGGSSMGGGERFSVVALPATTGLLKPDVVEGSWLEKGDVDAVVVNSGLASRAPALRVGQPATLRIGPQLVTLRVKGRVREPFASAAVYLPLAFFESRGHTGVANSLRLVLERTGDADVQAVRERLDTALQAQGVRGAVSSTSKAERRYAFDQHMLMVYAFLIAMAAILAGVGGLGLMTTISLNVLERRRELGVLRAIGATPRAVFSVVAVEALAVALLGFLLAALLAWPVTLAVGELLIRRLFRMPPALAFEPLGLVLWLLLSLALGALASLAPAWHASRREVREAISYE